MLIENFEKLLEIFSLVNPVFHHYYLLQALVMYQLYDRGLVKSLDDPLSDYCPRFSMFNPFNSRNITLCQIASQVLAVIVY